MAVIEKALTVYDTYLRSEKGPRIPESIWDNEIVPNAAIEMKTKYDVSFGDDIIPTDQDLMNRLFMAGMDLLTTVGIYNVDTERIIKVTEDEVKAGLKAAPKEIRLGSHNDMVILAPRKGNSSKKPIIQGGPTGATVSEDIFVSMFQSYAQEPIVDTIVSGVMATIDGVPATTN
ncbi:MAG: monomethylamine:corrinoid methyltransferase, partial [Euryarchaeota archaeon]|nr:monomethylamine:corrinoid methyltransferase [Euryarchaeota archaeon]